MLIVGAFLSIRMPLTGPAVVVLPAWSATVRSLVLAFVVSVLSGTLVVSAKLAGVAGAEVASLALQARLTSAACQALSAAAQFTVGAVVSTLRFAPRTGDSALPAASRLAA